MGEHIFDTRLNAAHRRLEELERAAESGDRVLPETLEELRIALEELNAAYEQLYQQNEELLETQLQRDTERQRYAELFELAPDAYVVTDSQGRIEEANWAAQRLLRRSDNALLGKPLVVFVAEEERWDFRRHLDDLRAGAGAYYFDLVLRPTGGEPFPASVHAGPVRERDDTVTGIRWIVRDETVMVRTQAALRDSEARYRAIVETAVEGIVTIDEIGTVLSFNPAARRMFGYAPDEVIGNNVSMLMPAPWRDEHDGYLARYLETGEARIIGIGREIRGLRNDGTTFPMDLSVSEYHDETGRMFVGLLRDISARKESEQALRRYEEMVSATTDLMAIVDREYRYLAVNRTYVDAFRIPLESIIGRPVSDLLGEDRFERVVKPRLDECLAGAPVTYEQWMDFPARGPRYVEVSYAPFRDGAGAVSGVVVDVRDRTEAHRYEEEAQQRRMEIAHVGRLASLGEMASGIAHELNQPLAAITSYCDAARRLLEAGAGEPGEIAHVLESASGQAQRAGAIIRRLRSLARRSTGVRAPVDLAASAREVIELAGPEARGVAVAIRVVPGADTPPVHADPIQIEQVILNLVRNAVEAVSANPRERPREVTVRTGALDGDAAYLEVEDTGPGLEGIDGESLFDAFYTTKEEGMGVGLALCRGIAEAHGGRLQAREAQGGGAAFRLVLPIGDGRERRA